MKITMKKALLPVLLSSLFVNSTFANTLMPERAVGTTVGVSTEFAAFQAGKVFHDGFAAPATTEEWLHLQSILDAPGKQLGIEVTEKLAINYEKEVIAGVNTFVLTPKNIAPQYQDKWLIHIHGGAFVLGGGESALREAAWAAHGLGAKVISVDYRQPPLHPFPAAVNDAVAVYKEIIKTQPAESTAIFGASAGGNITLATTLMLKEQGIALPGAILAGTPAVDLKEKSDTWNTLIGLDPLGPRDGFIEGTFNIYAGDEKLDHPFVSPIYADISEDFPPTMLISGTRDLLLSDTVRMHRKLRAAGVDADLHVYDGQSHGDYMAGIITPFPESDDAIRELATFFDKHIN